MSLTKCKMLIIGGNGGELYEKSLYYLYNFSININYSKIKSLLNNLNSLIKKIYHFKNEKVTCNLGENTYNKHT